MFKINILLLLFIPSILFSQGKSDFLGKWKVDNISFQIKDSLLQQAQINELENKYQTYYFEQEKNTTFSFFKNDSVYVKSSEIQKGTFNIVNDQLIIYNQNKETKSIYFYKIISPIYIELKTITETLSYSIFIKKNTNQ